MIRGFVFYSLPSAWVAFVTEIRHTKILNILSQMGRCFLYYSFPVAGVVMFEALFVNSQSNEENASLDRVLNILSQKVESFLFYSFPVTRSLPLRHTLILNILSQVGRNFLIFFFSFSWGRSFHRLPSHTILNIWSQMARAFIFYIFPVAGVVFFKAFEVFMV